MVSVTPWLTFAVTAIGVLLLPLIALLFRVNSRWIRMQDRQDRLIKDVEELVRDKERAHAEMITTMREDRAATDKRLRWLEEHLWNTSRRPRLLPFCYIFVMVS